RCVTVVDRRTDVGGAEFPKGAGLILRERFGRIEVERAILRLVRQRVEYREVEGERLSRGGAGRQDQVFAAGRRVPGLALMAVEPVEWKCFTQVGMKLCRQRDGAGLRGRDRLEVRQL